LLDALPQIEIMLVTILNGGIREQCAENIDHGLV